MAVERNSEYVWISIHALREESDSPSEVMMTIALLISIHALREESDPDNRLG